MTTTIIFILSITLLSIIFISIRLLYAMHKSTKDDIFFYINTINEQHQALADYEKQLKEANLTIKDQRLILDIKQRIIETYEQTSDTEDNQSSIAAICL